MFSQYKFQTMSDTFKPITHTSSLYSGCLAYRLLESPVTRSQHYCRVRVELEWNDSACLVASMRRLWRQCSKHCSSEREQAVAAS